MLFEHSAPYIIQHAIWLPTRLFLWVCCRAKISGSENLRAVNGNVVVATNHVTEIDPLIIVATLPFRSPLLPLFFVAREKRHYKTRWRGLRRLLYGGMFFRLAGSHEAYAGLNDYDVALRNQLQAVESGASVCIFPVGKLHDESESKNPRGGATYLAAKTERPIVPIHIDGISRTTTLLDCLLRKPRVHVTIGAPIVAADLFERPVSTITANSQQECQAAAAVLMARINDLALLRTSELDSKESHGAEFEPDFSSERP